MIFPWQQNEWQHLLHLQQTKRLPHALLFMGVRGVGKSMLADHFSRMLLCAHPSADQYCNACHSCTLHQAKTHPNMLWVKPEKDDQMIKIDQIRQVNEFIQQSGLQGEYK